MTEKNIAVLIKVASMEFDKYASKELAKFDLTTSQYKIIKYIFNATERSVRQIDIEKFFFMTNPTVTGIVKNLEKKGLIERIPNPEDGRSKVIVPTGKLSAMKEEILSAGNDMEKRFTCVLSDEENITLGEILTKLIECNNAKYKEFIIR